MKKVCAFFAAIMTAATVWFLCSCGTDVMKNVSERRSAFFISDGDGETTVTAVSGVREDPYTLDGRVGELKPYTLITLTPANFDVDAVYTFKAEAGDSVYGGTLTVHPFAASFSAEIDAEIVGEFTVVITVGGASADYTMKALVTPEMISFDQAIAAAENEFDALDGGYEIRARIINNPIDHNGVCWHVSFYSDTIDCGVLLDPVTARVIAKKNQ